MRKLKAFIDCEAVAMKKFFVYALNKKWQTIVAALSCPDEKWENRLS